LWDKNKKAKLKAAKAIISRKNKIPPNKWEQKNQK